MGNEVALFDQRKMEEFISLIRYPRPLDIYLNKPHRITQERNQLTTQRANKVVFFRRPVRSVRV